MHNLYKIVDEENEHNGQLGVLQEVNEVAPHLSMFSLEFSDGRQSSFFSHQLEKIPKKLIFLDVDGVLNSQHYAVVSESRGVLGIDPYPAFLLGKIVLDTGCEVVLSSTWRLWKNAREDVRKQVVEFIDITPDLGNVPRGEEIQKWLKDNNCEDARYAILDDNSDMLESQLPNFFQTTTEFGLTQKIAKAVTEHLNKGSK